MADYVARYKLLFNDLASRGLLRTSRIAGQMTRSMARASRAAAVMGTAVVGATTLVNRATAERARLAESVQLSMQTLSTFEPSAKQIGLSFENIVDLAEEMTNKIGEMRNLGEMTSLQEGLSGLKLSFQAIKDLKPDEQFDAIFAAASNLGDIQRASSALDQIFGGEASKLAGAYLKTLERLNLTHEEYKAQQRSLNFLTAEGAAGALRYNDAISQTQSFLTSLSRDGFGKLGDAMAPAIDNFNKFIIANKTGIQDGVAATIAGIGASLADINFAEVSKSATVFVGQISALASTAGDLVARAGGIENVGKAFLGMFVVGKVGAFAAAVGAIVTLVSGPLVIGLTAAVSAGVLLWRNWDAVSAKAVELMDRVKGFVGGLDSGGKLAVAAAALMSVGIIAELGKVMAKYSRAKLLMKGGLVIGVTFAAVEAFKALDKFISDFEEGSKGAVAAGAITTAPTGFSSTGDLASQLAAEDEAFNARTQSDPAAAIRALREDLSSSPPPAPPEPLDLNITIDGEIEGARITGTRVLEGAGSSGSGPTTPFERLRQRGLR